MIITNDFLLILGFTQARYRVPLEVCVQSVSVVSGESIQNLNPITNPI